MTIIQQTNKPFTYLIGWSELNKYYYGVRYSKNCQPESLWTTYFTSSNYVNEYREKYGEPDIIQVRKVFNNEQDACTWEYKFLSKVLNSDKRDMWINKAVGHNEYAIDDEVKEKISKSRKKYIENRTPEQAERDYQARLKASASKESRQKISQKVKERFQNEEYRKHFEENVWTEENTMRLRKSHLDMMNDPLKKSEWLKSVQSDEYRQWHSENNRKRFSDPNERKRVSDTLKETLSSGVKRQDMSEKAKASNGNRLATRYLNKIDNDTIIKLSIDEIYNNVKGLLKDTSFDEERLMKNIKKKKSV